MRAPRGAINLFGALRPPQVSGIALFPPLVIEIRGKPRFFFGGGMSAGGGGNINARALRVNHSQMAEFFTPR